MFRTRTRYEAACKACGARLLDESLTRYFGDDVSLWISDPKDVPALAGDDAAIAWAVVDGKLRCADCASADADVKPVPVEALTSVTTWTFHCDTCTGAYTEEESDADAVLYDPVLYEYTHRVMEARGWTVVETTAIQPDNILVDIPGAPKRTWEATCEACIAENAWSERLAAAA
jgi:hypothetical protein